MADCDLTDTVRYIYPQLAADPFGLADTEGSYVECEVVKGCFDFDECTYVSVLIIYNAAFCIGGKVSLCMYERFNRYAL